MSAARGMPRRVQRQRTKGWRMPPGAVYVGRPSKYGNPCEVELFDKGGPDEQWQMADYLNPWFVMCRSKVDAAREAVERFECYYLWALPDASRQQLIDDLAGRILVCWCPEWDKTTSCPHCGGPGCPACVDTGYARYPCHGDPLLIEANPDVTFPWADPS